MRKSIFSRPLAFAALGLAGSLALVSTADAATADATGAQRDAYVQSHAAIAAAEQCQGAFTKAQHQSLAAAVRSEIGADLGVGELHLLQQGKNQGRELAIHRGCSDDRTQALLQYFDANLAAAAR